MVVQYASSWCSITSNGTFPVEQSNFLMTVKWEEEDVIRITGSFTSETEMAGTYWVAICGSTIILAPSTGSWTASWQSASTAASAASPEGRWTMTLTPHTGSRALQIASSSARSARYRTVAELRDSDCPVRQRGSAGRMTDRRPDLACQPRGMNSSRSAYLEHDFALAGRLLYDAIRRRAPGASVAQPLSRR